MKILLINQFCGHGSTGRICTDLYNIAKKMGMTVILLMEDTDIPLI